MDELKDEVRTKWKAFPIVSIKIKSLRVAKDNFLVPKYEILVLHGKFKIEKECRVSTLEI